MHTLLYTLLLSLISASTDPSMISADGGKGFRPRRHDGDGCGGFVVPGCQTGRTRNACPAPPLTRRPANYWSESLSSSSSVDCRPCDRARPCAQQQQSSVPCGQKPRRHRHQRHQQRRVRRECSDCRYPPEQCRCGQHPPQSSSSSCSTYDHLFGHHGVTRPPPLIGSAENIQVLLFTAPTVAPIVLGQLWQLSSTPPPSGSLDGMQVQLTGSNTAPIGIETLPTSPYYLLSTSTLYYTAIGSFAATPESSVSSSYGINEDPQYGCARISVYDGISGFRIGWIVTNSLVYVLYERTTAGLAFTYLVPVATRSQADTNTYTVAISLPLHTFTLIMDGITRLTLTRPGAPIDAKFMTGSPPTIFSQSDFPLGLQAEVAILALPMVMPACQMALFDLCSRHQSLQYASQTVCANGPIETQPFNTTLSLALSALSLTRHAHIDPPCQTCS